MGIDHSSSLTSGEVAFEEETSPRREGCFLRGRLASDREDDDDGIMLWDSGRAGGSPIARDGWDGCRERVRCLFGESAMRRSKRLLFRGVCSRMREME